jgi:hypothetical protein
MLRKTITMSKGKRDCIKKNSTMTPRRRRSIKRIESFVEQQQQQHHGKKEQEVCPTITIAMSKR